MIIDVKRHRRSSSPSLLFPFSPSLPLSHFLSFQLSVSLFLFLIIAHHRPDHPPWNSNAPGFAPPADRLLRAPPRLSFLRIFTYTSLAHARFSTSGAPSRVVVPSYPVPSLATSYIRERFARARAFILRRFVADPSRVLLFPPSVGLCRVSRNWRNERTYRFRFFRRKIEIDLFLLASTGGDWQRGIEP